MSEVQRGGRFRHFRESIEEASLEYRQLEQAPAMYELLKEIASRSVFTDPSGGVISQCLICGAIGRGHSSDCRLAAVLKAVEGEESA